MNKKILLSSILTLVLCVSIITGATFALFTSESKTNIAVTSGKVDVVASIDNVNVYSPTLISQDGTVVDDTNIAKDGVFANGGTASLTDAVLTLDKVTPGDKVTFQIMITNNSNVAVQYRTVIRTLDDNGLVDGLKMNIGGEYDGSTKYTNWAPLSTSDSVMILECSVELPADAGNEYQDKTCRIVFTVEAVQGNTATDNYVAKIGTTNYSTLEGAIEAAQAGETVEITRPGTYAPFKIDKENVTVKGIIGETKAESTVIRTTATSNIQTYADGITLENLRIETPVAQSLNWMHAGAIDPYISTDSGIVAKNLTVKGCHFTSNGAVEYVMLYCTSGLNFVNNTVDNFDIGVYVMSDGHAAGAFNVTGNTFNNVKEPVNAYWGGSVNENYDGVVNITGNTVNGDGAAHFIVWDYAQNANDHSSFSKVTLTGNKGNIVYDLTHFDYKVAVDKTVALEDGQSVVYLSKILVNVPNGDKANYYVENYDGSEWNKYQGYNTLTATIGDHAAIYTLAPGKYNLVEISTGTKTVFTVTEPKVGVQQTVEVVVAREAGTIDELKELLRSAAEGSEGNMVINITKNFDLSGDWTPFSPKGYNGVNNITINGGGNTLSNLNAPLMIGSFAGNGIITINDLTITNADFTLPRYNGLGLGAFVAYVDCSGGVALNNCHLSNANIECTDGYAGGLVGYISDGELIINNCSVSKTNVKGFNSTGAVVGNIAAGCTASFKNVSTSEVTAVVTNTNANESYRVGTIVGTIADNTTFENVTSSDSCTATMANGKTSNLSKLYGRIVGGTFTEK